MSSVGRPARALFSCRPPALWDKRTQSVGLGHTAACQIQCSRTLSIGTCLTQGPRVSLGQVSGRERSWRRRRAYSSHPASAPPTKEGSEAGNRPKVTLTTLRKLWREKKPMTMLTAYDYPTGLIVDRAGMDMCLVGDSLGMVCLGYDSTTSVTMEDMIHHCRATSRGVKKAFLVGDLPFGAYHATTEQAIRNACRLMQEGNVESIKLEGGRVFKERISALTGAGIPVMGHLGLTPQSQAALGGYRVQGKTAARAMHLLEDALALQDAGCWSIVLEAIPAPVAKAVTNRLHIPTIGIGAGQECSGQVLVSMDMLGIFDKFLPRFCKQYAQLSVEMRRAVEQYGREVSAGTFPGPEHCYPMPPKEEEAFQEALIQWDQRQV